MEGAHEEAFARLRDRVHVVATADPIRERAEQAAQALGAEVAVTDYRDVINDVDAALIVVPHRLHHPIGMDFIRHGKHVLIEKPLAVSEQECLELIRAASSEDVLLMVAYPLRYHPLVVAMKNELDAGRIGEVFQIAIWTEQLTQWPKGDWHSSRETLGGGQLFSHGCHYVDLLLWMLGDPVEGAHFGCRKGTPWMEAEGTSNITIKFASGALGYHFGTWGARGTKHGYEFHAHGSDGMLALNLATSTLMLHKGNSADLIHEHRGSTKYVEGELSHFVACLDGKAAPLTDGPRSLQGLRVIWRLYQAENEGRIADLSGLGLDAEWEQPGLDLLPPARRRQ